MRKMKKLCAAMSMLLVVAVAAPMLSGSTPADAAKKPKLSSTKLNMTVGSSKTLKVKNYKKKVTWKSSKKAVAKLSNIKKTSVKITAKKKGTSKVTATLKVGGKKRVLTCNVTVNPKNIPTPVPDVPTPAPTATATVDPDITPTPTPTFDYDNYANCLWKKPGAHIQDVFGDYFISGVSTDLGSLRYGERSSFLRYHFGSVSMGNETKMESIINDDITDAYPDGIAKANVNNYYATQGQGKIIMNYENLEKVLSYCKANGLKLRYHAFVWHSQVREYFFLQDYNWSEYELEDYDAKGWDKSNYHKFVDPETAKKRLEDYIDQVIEYIYSHGYGEVVYAYDVINEATNGGGNRHSYYVNESAASVDEILSTSGSGPKFGTNGGVKTSSGGKSIDTNSSPEDVEKMMGYEGRVPANDSYWYSAMGADYLYLSFLYAHNAVEKYYEKYKTQFNYTEGNKPSLIYNDYNDADSDHIALAKYINTACNLVNATSGVKYCDGIGLQSHSKSENMQEKMIKNIADAGLEVQITELDEGEGMSEDAHASKMKRLYNIYKKYSKKGEYGAAQSDDYVGVTSVTQWGICDGLNGSWHAQYICKQYDDPAEPNLSLEPKAAFYAILQAGGVDCGDKDY